MSDLPNQITELLPENRTLPQEIVLNTDEQQQADNKLVLTSKLEGCMCGNVTIGVYVLVDKKGTVTIGLGNNAGGIRRDPRKTQGALVGLDTKTGDQIRLSDIDVRAYGSVVGRIDLLDGNTKPVSTGPYNSYLDDASTTAALKDTLENQNSPVRIVTFSWDGYA